MSSDKLKRMVLSGGIQGSAILRERDGCTRVSIALMGARSQMTLAAYGGSGVTLTEFEGSAAEIPQEGVCAMALLSGSRVVSSGFTGECREHRTRILDEIRIRAAERTRRPQPPKKPAESPKKQEPTEKNPSEAGHSATVTQTILEQARRLFGALDGNARQGAAPKREIQEDDGFENIANPFPRTFPGSVWKRKHLLIPR